MKKAAVLAPALFFSFISPLWSCPLCADLLERGRDAVAGLNLAQGLFLSIVVMLSIPAATAGGLYLYFRKKSRQSAGSKKS